MNWSDKVSKGWESACCDIICELSKDYEISTKHDNIKDTWMCLSDSRLRNEDLPII